LGQCSSTSRDPSSVANRRAAPSVPTRKPPRILGAAFRVQYDPRGRDLRGPEWRRLIERSQEARAGGCSTGHGASATAPKSRTALTRPPPVVSTPSNPSAKAWPPATSTAALAATNASDPCRVGRAWIRRHRQCPDGESLRFDRRRTRPDRWSPGLLSGARRVRPAGWPRPCRAPRVPRRRRPMKFGPPGRAGSRSPGRS